MSKQGEALPLPKKIRFAIETSLVYVLYGFFRMLPLETASRSGGWLLGKLGPRTRLSRVADRNLSLAFPEKSQLERDDIRQGMWNNLGRVIGEYPHLHRLWANVELVGAENIIAVRDSGKAALFFTAHIANWEIPALSNKNNGLDLNLVYRKPNNPWIDSLLCHIRSAGSSGFIAKGPAGAREIVSVLRKGGVVGMLIDQKMNEGISIPFFGHEAMTAPAIASFTLKFKCPILPFRVERLAGCRFRVTAYPPMEVRDTGNKDEDIKYMLTEINRVLEGWIRERPEQWLWIHRRWPKKLYST